MKKIGVHFYRFTFQSFRQRCWGKQEAMAADDNGSTICGGEKSGEEAPGYSGVATIIVEGFGGGRGQPSSSCCS